MSPKGESPHTTICNIRIGRKGACKLPKNPNVQIAAGPDAANQTSKRLCFWTRTSNDKTTYSNLILEKCQTTGEKHLSSPYLERRERHLASNYRLVSLTSISCNLLKHITYIAQPKYQLDIISEQNNEVNIFFSFSPLGDFFTIV